MARPRITKPRPQNMGQNRKVQMKNNTRAVRPMPFQQQNFQGGIGQGPPVVSGARPPGPPQPGAQQGARQCPAGQKPGRTSDGRMGCVPDRQAGVPGASPTKGPGTGTPNRNPRPSLKEGY